MSKLTLVFYQFPAALHELNAWEIIVKPFKEVVDQKGRLIYTVYDKENNSKVYEKLYCFNINDFTLDEIETLFIRKDFPQTKNQYIYNKTLIFGKVTLLNLIKVQEAIKKLEL